MSSLDACSREELIAHAERQAETITLLRDTLRLVVKTDQTQLKILHESLASMTEAYLATAPKAKLYDIEHPTTN